MIILGCLGQAEFENLYDGLILADTSPETALAFCRGFVIPNRHVIFGTPDDPISVDIPDNPDFSSSPVIPYT